MGSKHSKATPNKSTTTKNSKATLQNSTQHKIDKDEKQNEPNTANEHDPNPECVFMENKWECCICNYANNLTALLCKKCGHLKDQAQSSSSSDVKIAAKTKSKKHKISRLNKIKKYQKTNEYEQVETGTIWLKPKKQKNYQRKMNNMNNKNVYILQYGYFQQCESNFDLIIPIDIRFIIIYYSHTYNIFGIGNNKNGQFGSDLHGCNTVLKWTRLFEMQGLVSNINNIYRNYDSIMIKTIYNEIFVSGNNKDSRLGINVSTLSRNNNIETWSKINIRSGGKIISNGISNQHHTFIQNQNNELLVSGWNSGGQFGNGEMLQKGVLLKLNWSLRDEVIMEIQCGLEYSIFLTSHNNVFFCGQNSDHLPDGPRFVMNPTLLERDVKKVAVGKTHIVLLTKNGNVKNFGFGRRRGIYFENRKINIIDIKCGDEHVLYLSDDGKTYSMGRNSRGQIGNGMINNSSRTYGPCFVKDDIQQIECGGFHSLLLSKKNSFFTFGDNRCFQCSSINKQKVISTPFRFDKIAELNDNFHVEKAVGLYYGTLLICS